MKSTVLVIDGGGRGSALVEKYSQSKYVGRVFAVPGNDLMKINTNKSIRTYPKLKTTSIPEILKICKKEKVDLVDVAQDNAVEVGLSDALRDAGFIVVGPGKEAGRIEWDKIWSREFMKKYKIPHPSFNILQSEAEGKKFIQSQKNQRWVIKANGLTAGKGVLIANDNKEALGIIGKIKNYKKKKESYLIEKCLVGEEFSSFAISDGKDFKFIASAQDHKRVFDSDLGSNTGGMGCSCPPLVINKKIQIKINEIFKKVFDALKKEGTSYIGVLYLGGMLVKGKVYVIEFNARWGDPEAQVIVPGIINDFYELSLAAAGGNLKKIKLKSDRKSRVGVAGTARGYPGDSTESQNKQIYGLEDASKSLGVKIYGAGIKIKNNKYYTNGGRLFYVVGEGEDVIDARQKAYSAMGLISVEGDNLHYRTDIGWRDVERLSKKI